MKIGIAGAGAIGSILAAFIREMPEYELAGIYDINIAQCQKLAADLGVPASSLDSLINRSELVMEATCAKAMPDILREIINAGKMAAVMSVGGFALDPELAGFVESAHGKVFAPSGGIAGIDGLLALREAGLDSVKISTVKSPSSLAGAPYFQKPENRAMLDNLSAPLSVFSGSAAEAIRAFPANVNLAVTVSLAGIGFERTNVEILADPNARKTKQTLVAHAGGCSMRTEIEGPPLAANPRTSMVAACSAKALLREIVSTLCVGT